MGHRTTLNVNVKINDFINYSKAGKADSAYSHCVK